MARFWEFAQLSDSFKGMSVFDQVPRISGKLYIGGLSALYKEPDPLKEGGVTHVLSALDFDVRDSKQLKDYKHLTIGVDDNPHEDLLRHFPQSNAFIDEGLQNDGGVFVHCAMGVSRSATFVCAYLMWKYNIGSESALKQLREGRDRARPNAGFMEQLAVYGEMLKAKDEASRKAILQKWKDRRTPGSKL
jgi:dual specificity phosphatase 12